VLRANDELQNQQSPAPRSTRRIEVQLPSDIHYQAGDHFGVLAYNSPEEVERVARRFGCDDMTTVRIHKNDTRRTPLPAGQYIRLSSILMAYLELHEVATRGQIKRLIEYTELPSEREHLRSFVGNDEESEQRYRQEVLGKHLSLIDVLESHPSCDLPLGIYLELLSPMHPRYYSISSSPLVTSDTCRITVGVLEEQALSGRGIYKGTCSSFLRRRKPDEAIYGFVQKIKSPFHLPEDNAPPIIMVSAGTGLAPFMGFLQERSMLKQQGKQVGSSLLFFGCRHPDQDFIYKDELEEYERQGITEIQAAFSRAQTDKKMYVQDKVLEQQEKVWDFIQQGAATFICGDLEKMVPAVGQSYRSIYQQKQGATAQEAEQWLDEMTSSNRYVVDIWGTTSAVF
jgi:cytochrome P450 / NADPH-cytochrome P450 reductase